MNIHRCRFLDCVPHAIESVDVEPGKDGRLAILRANADIEVWSLKQGERYCEFRIAGAIDTPVRRVAWGVRSVRMPHGRLFSCGLHGLVTEWDLRTLAPRASFDSLGGAAWSMAVHTGRQLLAVGCEDGGCSVFDLSDEGLTEPPLVHRTPPQGGRLLSVAFSPQGTHLACSAADGSVRVWHVPSWMALCRYVLESDGRRKPPLVWSVLLLSDLCVVTGDSTGHVCFYDGRHGTLVRRFASHQADVLALAVARDENRARLLCAHDGSEVSVWQLPLLPPTAAAEGNGKFGGGGNGKGAASPGKGAAASPGKGAAASPGKGKGAAGGNNNGGAATGLAAATVVDSSGAPRKLLLLRPKLTARTINCVAISGRGDWLAVGAAETRLYRLGGVPAPAVDGPSAAPPPALSVSNVPLPEAVQPAGCCVFSPDERLLVIGGLSGLVQTITLDEANPTVHTLRGAPDAVNSRCALVQICISPDAQWIATVDTKRRLYLHSLDGLCFTSALPPIASPPTAFSFLPGSPLLAVASADKSLSLYDVERSVFTVWSQRHAKPLPAISASTEVPYSIATNPARPSAPILCSPSWLCRVEVDARPAPPALDASHLDAALDAATPRGAADGLDQPAADTTSPGSGKKGKRKRGKAAEAAAAADAPNGASPADAMDAASGAPPSTHVVRNYGGMLLFGVVAPDEAVVVEQPWLRVMDHFPPALYKHRFGS